MGIKPHIYIVKEGKRESEDDLGLNCICFFSSYYAY